MRARALSISLALTLSTAFAMAQAGTKRTTLDMYVVDVEGGNAVLFVTPSGESVLIDAGNGGPGAVRDAERIDAVPVAPFVLPPQGQQAVPAPEHNGRAYYIKISAQLDGAFTVTNTRNGFSKTYGVN